MLHLNLTQEKERGSLGYLAAIDNHEDEPDLGRHREQLNHTSNQNCPIMTIEM